MKYLNKSIEKIYKKRPFKSTDKNIRSNNNCLNLISIRDINF